MEGPCLSEIVVILEESHFSLQCVHYDQLPKYLFVDSSLSIYDPDFPSVSNSNCPSYLYIPETLENSPAVEFLNSCLVNKIAYRALDETCDHIYFIACTCSFGIITYILLKYSIQDLVNSNINLSRYFQSLTHSRIQYCKFKLEFVEWFNTFTAHINNWVSYSTVQKNSIQKLNDDIEYYKANQTEKIEDSMKNSSSLGECILCCDKFRNIVFLPCGHVVACLFCTVKKLKIELNKKIVKKRSPSVCPLCKGIIEEAREIIF
jgi:Zinc finger, C3HC4 type (RING finger)